MERTPMRGDRLKNIDTLFREKLERVEYSPNESAYTLMDYLLRQQKRKKRLLFIRLFSAVVLSVSFFYLLLNLFAPGRESLAVKKQNQFSPNFNIADQSTVRPQISRGNATGANEQKEISPHSSSSKNISKNYCNYSSVPLNTLPPDSDAAIAGPQPQEEITVVNEIKKEETEDGYLESSSRSFYIPWDKDSVKIKIHSTGKELNSVYPDYAPVINADGSVMYFTSRRPATEKERKKGKAGVENIYFSSFNNQSGKWSEAVFLAAPINSPGRFNSAAGLSNDGQRLFIYRDDKFGNGDIYESVLQGNAWSEPQPLPEPINSKYHETSATLSPDGNTIYFVSNRLDGKGEQDIWCCTKNKAGKWGEAKNLGSTVNSSKDEEGVFMHPDGKTLYFSSRGHNGFGGYDIFYTRLENRKWTAPVNLGPVINTFSDDVYFVVEASGQHAYYSSVREDGLGEKDIYKIDFIFPEEKKKPSIRLTLFKGNVLDKLNQQPLESDIELIDLEKDEQITTLKSNSATGAFMLSLPAGKNYAINVKRQGYLFYSENFNIPPADEYKEVHKTVLLSQLKPGAKMVLKNIFYDYDKATLRPESKAELIRLYTLLLQNPKLKVELSAHTDSRGSDEYNLKLSQSRAQSCVDYLLSMGINKEQITAKGYGEQQAIFKEEDINRMNSETEKEFSHQQNRRTEIKIIKN